MKSIRSTLGIGTGAFMPKIRRVTGAAPQGALDLPTLFGGTQQFFFNPDRNAELGGGSAVTYVANTSFNIPDLSGQGVTLTQTGAACPIYSASEATINNRPIFSGDNTSSRYVFHSWNPPAPATTPVWWYIIARMNSWSTTGAARHLIGGSSGNHMGIRCQTSTPQVAIANGGTANLQNMVIGTWYRIICNFTGSTAGNTDSWQIGSTVVPNMNFGNSNPTGGGFFCTNVSGLVGTNTYGDFSIALAYSRQGAPSAPLIASADAQVTARYGLGVQL